MSALATRAFAFDARVQFKEGYRPTASDLPMVMTVFASDRRNTSVLVNGRVRFIATVALEKA